MESSEFCSRGGAGPRMVRRQARGYNPPPMSNLRRPMKSWILLLLVAALALASGITFNRWVSQHQRAPAPELEVATSLLGHSLPVPTYRLTDSKGQPFTNADLEGHWTLMFFGYTHCPDVCPTTLSTLAQAMELLRSRGDTDLPQVVFVSVDPERDTPQQLGQYTRFFDPQFIGVTGTEQAIKDLTSGLGIIYAKVDNPKDPENYLVDHSAAILGVAPNGRLAALFSAPHRAPAITHDLQALQGAYQAH